MRNISEIIEIDKSLNDREWKYIRRLETALKWIANHASVVDENSQRRLDDIQIIACRATERGNDNG